MANLNYINETVWGPIENKWMGTYESELHEFVLDFISGNYDVIIDVGSSEGYYSVGIGYKAPSTRIYSFDTDVFARRQQRRMAKLNNVRNVHIGSWCSHDDISSRTVGKTGLIVDVEGYEYKLLDPNLCRELLKCNILVEVHHYEMLSPLAGAHLLASRFASTHAPKVVGVNSQKVAPQEVSTKYSAEECAVYLDEIRNPEAYWLWLRLKEPESVSCNELPF